MQAEIALIATGLEPVQRELLDRQAQAVDLAVEAKDPLKITSATRQLNVLLRDYGLLNTKPAADPFEKFLEELAAE